MPNIWHGVTVCTQAEADERIPELLKVPGKKWISIEPMLGPIDLKPQWLREAHTLNQQISLCVVGGESGKNARPLHPDWARSVRNQCQAAGVPFYFKQHGEWAWVGGQKKRPNTQMRICRGGEVEPTIYTEKTLPKRSFLMFGTECVVSRVGLKAAGRTLDGRIWDELPWRKA
jgi:protein gp37